MKVIETSSGKITGIQEKGITKYLGIPYAKPPVEELRFMRAKPIEPWEEILVADHYKDIAAQKFMGEYQGSLDCLTLNIMTPEVAEKLPVFVWIHGGGYMTGSASDPLYHGDAFVKDGIIYVSFQYRLNLFGVYDFSTYKGCEDFESNCALSDMVLALKWIKENIRAFGGDPNNITIGGESAGGSAVLTLMAVPEVKGCFARVIAQSALPNCVMSKSVARENMDLYLEGMGWTVEDLHKLRTEDPFVLIEGTEYVAKHHQYKNPGMFLPCPVLDDLLPDMPIDAIGKGCSAGIPLLIGSNLNEGTMFVHEEATGFPNSWEMVEKMFRNNKYEDVFESVRTYYENQSKDSNYGSVFVKFATDYAFELPAILVAQKQAQYSEVWMYRYDFVTEHAQKSGMLASHAYELPAVFSVLSHPFSQQVFKGVDLKVVHQLIEDIRRPWVNFIKGKGQNDIWPKYKDESSKVMVFDNNSHTKSLERQALIDLWGDMKFY